MSDGDQLILVNLGNGVVVAHTMAEWAALVKGVDLEAARAMTEPIESEEDTE